MSLARVARASRVAPLAAGLARRPHRLVPDATALTAVLALWCSVATGQVVTVVPLPDTGINSIILQGPDTFTTFGGQRPSPARDGRPPASGSSRLAGTVRSADSGQPLRGALVRITSAELGESRSVSTDTAGRYQFHDLPAGRYTIGVQKGGYVSVSWGQKRLSAVPDPGRPFPLGERHNAENVDIILPRGGVITGRVVDELGEPVPDATVQVLRSQFVQGQRRLLPGGRMDQTNDIGEFRLFGLAPGQYFLTAILRSMGPVAENSLDRIGYATTYYPGTTELGSAQRLAVGPGETVSGIEVQLIATRTARISGTAFDSTGRPLSGGGVSLLPRGLALIMGGGGGPVRSDGSFFLTGVPPGQYLLRASGTPRGIGLPPEVSTASVDVSGDDITGVLLTPVTPVNVSGRVVVLDPSAAASLQPSAIRITLQPMSPGEMTAAAGGPPPGLKDDFTFVTRASPGRMLVRAMVGTPGWAVKSIRADGIDVTDAGLEIRPSQDIDDLEVELTNRAPQVSGVVTTERGEGVPQSWVLFFSQDRKLWTVPTGRYAVLSRTGDDGRYTTRALPPGDYYAIGLEFVDQTNYGDPDYLETLRSHAVQVSLLEGDNRTLDLRLQP